MILDAFTVAGAIAAGLLCLAVLWFSGCCRNG